MQFLRFLCVSINTNPDPLYFIVEATVLEGATEAEIEAVTVTAAGTTVDPHKVTFYYWKTHFKTIKSWVPFTCRWI